MTARANRSDLPLTPRQRELLHLLALGLTQAEAADRLGVSTHTIKTHAIRLYRRLGARNRADAVRLGHERGELGVGVEPPLRARVEVDADTADEGES